MYTVSVEANFSAIHRVRSADGSLEPPHGHDWRVRAYFGRNELDEQEMVVDFLEAKSGLEAAIADLNHANLNEIEVFRDRNPTAEAVAKLLFDRLRGRGLAALIRVEVTEAAGCVASFESGGAEL